MSTYNLLFYGEISKIISVSYRLILNLVKLLLRHKVLKEAITFMVQLIYARDVNRSLDIQMFTSCSKVRIHFLHLDVRINLSKMSKRYNFMKKIFLYYHTTR